MKKNKIQLSLDMRAREVAREIIRRDGFKDWFQSCRIGSSALGHVEVRVKKGYRAAFVPPSYAKHARIRVHVVEVLDEKQRVDDNISRNVCVRQHRDKDLRCSLCSGRVTTGVRCESEHLDLTMRDLQRSETLDAKNTFWLFCRRCATRIGTAGQQIGTSLKQAQVFSLLRKM